MSDRPISAAYLERKLRAVSGVQGSNPLPDLAQLAGLVTLEADRPEWAFPANEFFYSRGLEAVAGVGEFSYVTLENPAQSGVLVIVEEIRSQPNFQSGQANPVELALESSGALIIPPAGQIGSNNGVRRDTRIGLGTTTQLGSVAIVRQGNDAAPFTGAVLVTTTGILLAGNSTTQALGDAPRVPWVLAPGTRLWAVGVIVNNRICIGFSWRERPLEGLSELK